MELHESDTLQNKIDFPSIGKNVIFGRKKKNPVFFHRSSGNKTKTSQSSLPTGCKVLECALVGPSANGMSPEMETISVHAEKTRVTRTIRPRWSVSPSASPAASLQAPHTISTACAPANRGPATLRHQAAAHWEVKRGLLRKGNQKEPAQEE